MVKKIFLNCGFFSLKIKKSRKKLGKSIISVKKYKKYT